MLNIRERIEGGIYGLLVGDALGVPYEFYEQWQIPPLTEIEFHTPRGFKPSHSGIAPGTWSDDGAQALVLLDSLLTCGKLDIDHLARGMVRWYQEGYMAVDNLLFDVGIQTRQAIRQLKLGVKTELAARRDEWANGNGSLMRVLPLVLWHKGEDAELVHDAHQQSIVTHGHLRSQVCCAFYCLWARYMFNNHPDPWGKAIVSLRSIYGEDSPGYGELMESIRPNDNIEPSGSGYVVETLRAAKWSMDYNSTYELVVKAAVSLGGDTDTIACVAGGIAGIKGGVGAIPIRWLDNLRGKHIVQPLIESLIVWRSSSI
jgi:ADP-ribosylglycohydrolase